MSNRQKVAVAILTIIALVCFASTWALLTSEHKRRPFDPDNYPYKLSVVKKNNYVNFRSSDINSDGRSELFCLLDSRFENYGPPISMYYYSHDFRIIDEYRFDGEISPCFFDLDNDGEKEIVVSKRRNDSVFVEIRTLSQKTLADFFALTKDEHTREGRWDCHIEFVDLVDLNGEGRKDIVAKVLTNRTGSPRGLYAFDLRTGQTIWQYKTGALVHSVAVHDIDNDGKSEYLLTTHCAWNLKKPINGTDDAHVYFIIVDHQGNPIFKERFGDMRGALSQLLTGDIDGDQQTDYIVVYNNRERITGDEPTVIYLYQPSSNTLVRKLSLHRSFWYLQLHDITGDGRADLVFVDGEYNIGRISYINSIQNFKLIEEKQLPFQFIPGTVDNFIADLNNDAKNEILINTGDYLFVLDNRFNTQAIYPKLRFLSFVQSGFGKIMRLEH